MSFDHLKFESMVRSFYKPLYRYAYWITKSKSVAEDLVQETFARAWKNLNQLNSAESIKPWLFTILNRENARRFQRKTLPMVELTESWTLEDIADKNNELEKIPLQRAIGNLPNDYRQPLVLQVVAGMNTKEIAEVLSLKHNTVSTRLFRARAQLKKVLKDRQTTQSTILPSEGNK